MKKFVIIICILFLNIRSVEAKNIYEVKSIPSEVGSGATIEFIDKTHFKVLSGKVIESKIKYFDPKTSDSYPIDAYQGVKIEYAEDGMFSHGYDPNGIQIPFIYSLEYPDNVKHNILKLTFNNGKIISTEKSQYASFGSITVSDGKQNGYYNEKLSVDNLAFQDTKIVKYGNKTLLYVKDDATNENDSVMGESL